MLAGVPVLADAVAELVDTVRRPAPTRSPADSRQPSTTEWRSWRSPSTNARSSWAHSKTHPKGSPNYAPSCSTNTSGGNAKDSVEPPGGVALIRREAPVPGLRGLVEVAE